MGDHSNVELFLKPLGKDKAALSSSVRAARSLNRAGQDEHSATGAAEYKVEAAVAALAHRKVTDWQVSFDDVCKVLELADAAQPATRGTSLARTRMSGSSGSAGAPTCGMADEGGAVLSPLLPGRAAVLGGRVAHGWDHAGSDGEDIVSSNVPVVLEADGGESDMPASRKMQAAVFTRRRPSARPYAGGDGQEGRGVLLAVRGAGSAPSVREKISSGARPGAQDPLDSVFSVRSENLPDPKRRHDARTQRKRENI